MHLWKDIILQRCKGGWGVGGGILSCDVTPAMHSPNPFYMDTEVFKAKGKWPSHVNGKMFLHEIPTVCTLILTLHVSTLLAYNNDIINSKRINSQKELTQKNKT